jgi:UDP-glucose-4-epimerase GalE
MVAAELTNHRKNKGTVLLLGGAGYIGSHVNVALHEAGYETVILDNLIYGHRESVLQGRLVEGNIEDQRLVEDLFRQYEFSAVMHFSAYAYVGESVTEPGKYYRNNVVNTVAFLDVMRRISSAVLVFSSSCAVYGMPSKVPITEDQSLTPINPYGASKMMVERILSDYGTAYGLRYASLRYFNAAGADLKGRIGEWHEPETHLIPLVLRATGEDGKPVTVLGSDYDTPDGTCIRDYIHVEDLADAHILAMQQVRQENRSEIYNLGTGRGLSVKEIIAKTEQITGFPVKVQVGGRRPGDPPRLIADAGRAYRELGWTPRRSTSDVILSSAWNWHKILANKFVSPVGE